MGRLRQSVPTAPAFPQGEEEAPERARSVTRCVTRAVRGRGGARAPGAAQPPPLRLRRPRCVAVVVGKAPPHLSGTMKLASRLFEVS